MLVALECDLKFRLRSFRKVFQLNFVVGWVYLSKESITSMNNSNGIICHNNADIMTLCHILVFYGALWWHDLGI